MSLEAAADVRFDYVGSLQLARRLWALGDEVDQVWRKRVQHAEAALVDWLGVYGTEFAQRIDSESAQAQVIAGQLRAAADQWAARWAEAMNEQNRILFARETKHIEDNRSGWDNFVGTFVGHDDLPPQPPTIDVPTSPSFYATGSLTRY